MLDNQKHKVLPLGMLDLPILYCEIQSKTKREKGWKLREEELKK